MTTFSNVPLFGGAITVELPTNFGDVSEIRQVPDNQEVYLDRDGLTSVMFDLTERVTNPSEDTAALRFHLADIVETERGNFTNKPEDQNSDDGLEIWTSNSAHLSMLPPSTPAYTLLATTTPDPGPPTSSPTPPFTALLLTLVRLEDQTTDLVITVNVPHILSGTTGSQELKDINLPAGRLGKLLETGAEIRDRILSTLEVKDWGLFIQG